MKTQLTVNGWGLLVYRVSYVMGGMYISVLYDSTKANASKHSM